MNKCCRGTEGCEAGQPYPNDGSGFDPLTTSKPHSWGCFIKWAKTVGSQSSSVATPKLPAGVESDMVAMFSANGGHPARFPLTPLDAIAARFEDSWSRAAGRK